MTRLFIVDQSLAEIGGHHFDYTRLIARAADSAGICPIMVTHKSLDARTNAALSTFGEVRPVFDRTVYTRLSHLAGLSELKSGKKPATSYAGPNRDRSLPGRWLERRKRLGLIRARGRHISRFAADCERLFSDYTLDGADQVFFTTMSELDLLGLSFFLAHHPESLLPNWHVQFHFSVFSGRPVEFEDQAGREAMVHDCFQTALARIPYHQLKFYTTSQELLQQYRRFELMEFAELPYPVEPGLFENQSDVVPRNRPLRLTIAGGVRREKAQKHYMGNLVSSLWESHLASDRVQVHVQTNEPRAFGRRNLLDPSQARATSNGRFGDCVQLHSHPLPESEYQNLIGDSDMGLFFYDSRRYYSRRAGILGEFLASGKPVIVPAGCWLSRQIGEQVFQHNEQVIRDSDSRRTVQLSEMKWDCRNAPLARGVISFDQLNNPWRCSIDISGETPPEGVAVQFGWKWPRGMCEFANVSFRAFDDHGRMVSESRQVVSVRDDDQPSVSLFRCPPELSRAEFVFRNAYRNTSLSLADVEFQFLTNRSPADFPLGSVGIIVADPGDLPAAVDEIVRHYPHYLRTAVEFAGFWAANHDPRFTLATLLDRTCRYRSVA